MAIRSKTSRSCLLCGQDFFPLRNQKWCGKKCYNIARVVSPEHKAKVRSDWRESHKEYARQYSAKYRTEHPVIYKAKVRVRVVKRNALRSSDWGERLKHLAARAGGRAIKCGLPCDPNLKEFMYNNPRSTCQCCGVGLEIKIGRYPNSPSLDRVVPERGYTVDNVRVVCARCNFVKSNATVVELEAVVRYIYKETTTPSATQISEKDDSDELRIM